jgi:hypothetical protein
MSSIPLVYGSADSSLPKVNVHIGNNENEPLLLHNSRIERVEASYNDYIAILLIILLTILLVACFVAVAIHIFDLIFFTKLPLKDWR